MPGSKRTRGGQTGGRQSVTEAEMAKQSRAFLDAYYGSEDLDGNIDYFWSEAEETDRGVSLQKTLGVKGKDAKLITAATYAAIFTWSDDADAYRHPEKYGFDGLKQGRLLFDTIADHGGYKGELYRGVNFSNGNGEGDRMLQTILQKGVWTEPGPASFSTKRDTADSFALGERGSTSVVLHVKKASSGFDMSKWSIFDAESEVIQSSSRGANGWNITGHTTEQINGQAVHVLELEERK